MRSKPIARASACIRVFRLKEHASCRQSSPEPNTAGSRAGRHNCPSPASSVLEKGVLCAAGRPNPGSYLFCDLVESGVRRRRRRGMMHRPHLAGNTATPYAGNAASPSGAEHPPHQTQPETAPANVPDVVMGARLWRKCRPLTD